MTPPPYRPLTMQDVRAAPLTGLTHVSTFSGGGGTCLGFRLAGFQTLWANDVDRHARACYRLNLESPIDGRDIRFVTAPDLLTRLHLTRGALDVFEGSPPCTTFSIAGRRHDGWGRTTQHAGYVQDNVEDLFFEWLRLLDGLQPKTFVAENVAGLVKGVSKGYFKDILRRMQALGYRTAAQVLDAQWLGVPQQRARLIFLGVRADLEVAPVFPTPLPWRYSMRDAFASFVPGTDPIVRQQIVKTGFTRTTAPLDVPCPTVLSGGPQFGGTVTLRSGARRGLTIAEAKRVCSFPDDYRMPGSYGDQWARLGNSVPPLMAHALAVALRTTLHAAA